MSFSQRPSFFFACFCLFAFCLALKRAFNFATEYSLQSSNLAAEAREGGPLAFECVDHVHGRDHFMLGVSV